MTMSIRHNFHSEITAVSPMVMFSTFEPTKFSENFHIHVCVFYCELKWNLICTKQCEFTFLLMNGNFACFASKWLYKIHSLAYLSLKRERTWVSHRFCSIEKNISFRYLRCGNRMQICKSIIFIRSAGLFESYAQFICCCVYLDDTQRWMKWVD